MKIHRIFLILSSLTVLALSSSCGSSSGSSVGVIGGEEADGSDGASENFTSGAGVKVIKVEDPYLVAADGDLIFKIGYNGWFPSLNRSADGGTTFERISQIEDMGSVDRGEQALYLTPNGTLLWSVSVPVGFCDDAPIRVYRSTDRGDSFSIHVFDTSNDLCEAASGEALGRNVFGPESFFGTFAGGGDSPLFLFYCSGETRSRCAFFKSEDDGVSFAGPTFISLGYPIDVVVLGNNVFALPRINYNFLSTLFAISRDGGVSFSETNVDTIAQGGGSIRSGRIAVYGDNVYIVSMKRYWGDSYAGYLVKSTDGGQTFSEPREICSFGSDTGINFESISVFGEKLLITIGSGGRFPVRIMMSDDGGETFGDVYDLSDDSSFGTRLSSSRVDRAGNFFVFWADRSTYRGW